MLRCDHWSGLGNSFQFPQSFETSSPSSLASSPPLPACPAPSRVSSYSRPLHPLGVLVSVPALYGFIAATPCTSEEVSWM